MRYFMMIIGAAIYTYGLDVFLVPNYLIDGGVVGIALMASKLSDISFSILVMLINLPFLYVGYMQIGKSFTISTLFAIACISVFSAFVFFHPSDTHSLFANNQRSPIIHAVISSTGTGGYNMPFGINFLHPVGGCTSK